MSLTQNNHSHSAFTYRNSRRDPDMSAKNEIKNFEIGSTSNLVFYNRADICEYLNIKILLVRPRVFPRA